MMYRSIVFLLFALLVVVSCGEEDPPADAEATISAAVEATIEAIPTETAQPEIDDAPSPLPSSTTGSADTLSRLEVELWPDFDDPSVLVILSGHLPDSSPLPATITIPVPDDAQLNAVARISDEGLFDDIDYDISSPGQLTLTTPDPGFRVEYYAPYTTDGDQRSYTFQWQSDYYIEDMLPIVQEPAFADGLAIDRRIVDSSRAADGLLYHDLYPEELEPNETYSLAISYRLGSGELSTEAMTRGVVKPTSVVEIVKEHLNTGWTRFELPGYGFAVALPPGWLNYDPSTPLDDGVNEFVEKMFPEEFGLENNPLLSDLTQQGIVFMAYDFSTVTAPGGTPPGVNVMVQESIFPSASESVEIPFELLVTQLGIDGPISHQAVHLDGIPADKISYSIELTAPNGQITLKNIQYFANVDGDFFTITFGCTDESCDEYEESFKKIVQSLEWLE